MKRIFVILFCLLCLIGESFAQEDAVTTMFNVAHRSTVALYPKLQFECLADDGSGRTVSFQIWLQSGKKFEKEATVEDKCALSLMAVNGLEDYYDKLCGNVVDVVLRLSNGERIQLQVIDCSLDEGFDYVNFSLWNYMGGNKSRSEDEVTNTRYVLNQLMLYDIVALELNITELFYEDLYFGAYGVDTKISFKTKFNSSGIIRALAEALRDKVSDKTALPDVNNLDRSWSHTPLIRIIDNVARYENDIIANVAPRKKISFNFELGHYSDTQIPYLEFYSQDYAPISLEPYWGKDISVWFKLSNGVKYTTNQAFCSVTFTSNHMQFRASMNTFCDSRTPNQVIQPKTLLQQLSTYDIVEIGVLDKPIDLSQCDGSTAEHFAEMCEKMLEHTGATNCYPIITKQPNTSHTAAQSKSDAVAIARADKRAVYLMEYHTKIDRKDHISPREVVYTPAAMFITRDIPMDAVQMIMESAKGVKKCEVRRDSNDSNVDVTPDGFYLRVSGYEAMPCRYMSVIYDNYNLSKITDLYFNYAMPKGWGKGDIAKYAKAISEDINLLGVQMKKHRWSAGSIGYQGYHQGHTISIMYNTKYIKYMEATISILITYDKKLK